MAELGGPTRLHIVEADGGLVAETAALRVMVDLNRFALAVETVEGKQVLGQPRSVDPEHAPEARSSTGEHGDLASFDPATRYLGLTYGVDGMLLGSYNGSGRKSRWYVPTRIEQWSQDGDTLQLEAATDDIVGRTAYIDIAFLDDRVFRLRMKLDRAVGVNEMGWAAAIDPAEGFFGLGERFTRGNHRGHEVVNWVEDAWCDPMPGHDWTYWPVPFFLSSSGYGVLCDTTRRAVFRMASDRDDAWQFSVDGAELNAVVFWGPDPKQVVRHYTALTGRPPLPPVWAMGAWKTTLSGAEAVRAEAKRVREADLGITALWIYDQLELDTNSGWNSAMGYPEGEYPDLPGLIEELHADGFKVLGYLNPQFIAGRPRTDEGVARGYFLKRPDGQPYFVPGPDPNPEVGIRFGALALYDPTNPEGVAWWQEMLRRLLVEIGYDGWMHDFGEYTPRDAVFADGRTGGEIRNLYPTLYQQTAAEICRRVKPDFAFFVRSGYIGSNQWAPAAWPGDQHTDWSGDRGLPSILPAALSAGMCGVNTWGPDIGGFFDAYDGGNIAESTELWIRWCQFGALTPLMRDHLGPKRMTTPGAIDLWSNEQTVDTWRRFARLHNALFPYLYAYAAQAHETGVPTMRHLVLEFPDEAEALRQDYQYLLGNELLVAPVVEPNATTRQVWFPPGTWYDFWDDATFTGPGYIDVPAPIDQIPMFARAGSLLPLLSQPVVTLANAAANDLLGKLELRVYPAGDDAGARHNITFHDGSSIQLDESVDRIVLHFDERNQDRDFVVRLPENFRFVHGLADGVPWEPDVVDAELPRFGGDDSGRTTRLRVPTGVSSFTLYRG